MPTPLSPRQTSILAYFRDHPDTWANKSGIAYALNVTYISVDNQVDILYHLRYLQRRRAQAGAAEWEYSINA